MFACCRIKGGGGGRKIWWVKAGVGEEEGEIDPGC